MSLDLSEHKLQRARRQLLIIANNNRTEINLPEIKL